jgi:hypothetical protein
MGTEQVKPRCKFCYRPVEYSDGFMAVEVLGGDGFICHEECYQQSGEDEGYVQRLHNAIDEDLE